MNRKTPNPQPRSKSTINFRTKEVDRMVRARSACAQEMFSFYSPSKRHISLNKQLEKLVRDSTRMKQHLGESCKLLQPNFVSISDPVKIEKPRYELTLEEEKRREAVIQAFKKIQEKFNDPDIHQSIKESHAEDLIQICIYLFDEMNKLNAEIDKTRDQVKEHQEEIKRLITQNV